MRLSSLRFSRPTRRTQWEGRLGATLLTRSDFVVHGDEEVRSSMKGIAYLQRANLQVLSVARDKILARVAGFPNLVFAHVTLPETIVSGPVTSSRPRP